MGSGTDAARGRFPNAANALDDMKDQLVILLVQRMGGRVVIPVAEIDAATVGKQLFMRVGLDTAGKQAFEFEVRQK